MRLLRLPGTTASRLALVVLLVATLPLGAAAYLAQSLFAQASAVWFRPEVGEELDRGVAVHKAWVRAKKDDFQHLAEAVADDERVLAAAREGGRDALEPLLARALRRSPEIESYAVVALADEADDGAATTVAIARRATPLDPERERPFRRELPLEGAPGRHLVAVFAAPRENLDALERAGEVIAAYHRIEGQRTRLYRGYLSAFVLLLLATTLVTVPLGVVLARGVVRRIERLAAALGRVGGGDFTPRVPETGSDEVTELSKAFNRMLDEVEASRRKIEFLQRVGAWQEMARRLAHEIKNPLTPILLAVQECHRKYEGDDPRYRRLLDTTHEIVDEEVGALRRLVENFTNFARLPSSELAEDDLGPFLGECERLLGRPEVLFLAPPGPLPVAIDRQLLRRVLANLIDNGCDAAAEGPRPATPWVRISAAAEDDRVSLFVDDGGPGVPPEDRARIFEPYVTGKGHGTGLGLAIAMKIVVEHGGTLRVGDGPLGGARFTVTLPARR